MGRHFQSTEESGVGSVSVTVGADRAAMGTSAATDAAEAILKAVSDHGTARVVFASAPSQREMLSALAARDDLDWNRVVAFHMDEYVGLSAVAPQAFGQWLNDHLFAHVNGGHLIAINPEAPSEFEAERYAALVTSERLDLVCLGIGDNGHLAFNEPHQAQLNDDRAARVVTLDPESRRQQVADGQFSQLDLVPTTAITLTVPTLLAARTIVGTVPGFSKASSVAAALDGPIGTDCPASFLRTHDTVYLHLDEAAASRLSPRGDSATHAWNNSE
jgi:glucosamine-6-phosphate deaminase